MAKAIRWFWVVGFLLVWSCDQGEAPLPEGAVADRTFEDCAESQDRLLCQIAFVEDRGVQACWEQRSPEISCIFLGLLLLDDEDPPCEEVFESLDDLRRLRGSCERLRGQGPPSSQEAFDELYVQEMARWVDGELEGSGELDPVLRFLTLREGFAAAIIDEVSDANRSYLRGRDQVRRVLEEERRRAAE